MPDKNNHKWRKAHPKYRNARRKANYHRGRPDPVKTKRRPTGVKHRRWEDADFGYLLQCDAVGNVFSDKELARQLKRSVQAVQQMRYKLKKEEDGL